MSQPAWWNRLFGEVETVGVLPVPDFQRTMTPGKLFNVWAMASASAMTPLIGMLLFPYGLTYMVATIVIGWLIGLVPAGLFSEMGREVLTPFRTTSYKSGRQLQVDTGDYPLRGDHLVEI